MGERLRSEKSSAFRPYSSPLRKIKEPLENTGGFAHEQDRKLTRFGAASQIRTASRIALPEGQPKRDRAIVCGGSIGDLGVVAKLDVQELAFDV